MFNGLKRLWEGIKSMFTTTEIQRIVGRDVALSERMIKSIELWNSMLNGTAPWNDRAPAIGVEIGIVREFADAVLNEMEAKVEDNDNLDNLFQEAIKDLNENLQDGLALGSFIIKPLLSGGVEYVNADKFIPIEFNDKGGVNDCLFIQHKRTGEYEHYFRCERHTLTDKGLKITNKAYRSTSYSNLGTQISLTSVSGWEDYPEEIIYSGMDKMDFGFYKNPIKNRVDGSPCGVSIYSNPAAINNIKRADIQGARIDWEYESGERAIHTDERALRYDGNRNTYGLPKLDHRLYRGLNIDTGNGDLFKEYSPEMRNAAFIEGLETYYRMIEFNVGLAYGDLSDTQQVDKTATEIKSAKQRKYNRVTAIQENLKSCLEGLVDALAFYSASYTSGYIFICNFNDSILTDEETERNQDRQDVSMGVQRPEEYRAKWYGEDIETAKNNLPEQTGLLDNLNLR